MPPENAGAGLVPDGHPDRIRWNARYAAGYLSSFTAHPLAVRVFGSLPADLPDGPVADLACGPSGTALLAASKGRHVIAVDVSEVALGLLGAEAMRRGLDDLITLVHADLSAWRPESRSYALILCTLFWDAAVFRVAAGAVRRWRPARLGSAHPRSPARSPRASGRVVPGPRRARVAPARGLHPPGPE